MEITATLSAKHADKLARLEAHLDLSRDALLEFMLDTIYMTHAVDIGHFYWGELRTVEFGIGECFFCNETFKTGQYCRNAEAQDEAGWRISAHETCINNR